MRARAAIGVLLFAAWVCGSAQPSPPYRIAYLTGYSAAVDRPLLAAFKQGLRELGYVEGKNVVVEAKHADGQPERLGQLAQDLSAKRPHVFVVGSGAAALQAVTKVSSGTAIVMANVQDPLATGLVASLARPGGNITGLSDFHAASVTKRMELVKEAIPGLKLVGVLWNPDSRTNADQLADLERHAGRVGVKIVSLPVRHPADIQVRLDEFGRMHGALLLLGDYVLTTNMAPIARHAIDHRIPAVYTTHSWTEAGGFMAYGANFEDLYRRSAQYVDKILKGARPGDLPIEQPTKFDLIINLRTARAIGVRVPRALLQRADQVIE